MVKQCGLPKSHPSLDLEGRAQLMAPGGPGKADLALQGGKPLTGLEGHVVRTGSESQLHRSVIVRPSQPQKNNLKSIANL